MWQWLYRFQPWRDWLTRRELKVLIVGLLVVAGTWAFIELADEVVEGDTQWFDEWVVYGLRQPGNPALPRGPRWLAEMGRDITALGSHAVLALMTMAVGGFLLLQRKYGATWLLLISILSGIILSHLLKMFFDRARPNLELQLWLGTPSFPSGHSMLSAVVYLSLGTLLARVEAKRTIKLYVIGVAILVTFLVGLSRVYLGVHYPTDVLAGWVVGFVWALVCWLVTWYLQRRGEVESDRSSSLEASSEGVPR
jgi:undecaprenyl-diphosphatase